MKRLIRWLIVLGVIGGIGYAATGPVAAYLKERKRVGAAGGRGRPGADRRRGQSHRHDQSRAAHQDRLRRSGPIESIFVDFNSEVKKGDLMARIDPRLYKAAVARDQATWANQQGCRASQAQLQQANNDENRSKGLQRRTRTSFRTPKWTNSSSSANASMQRLQVARRRSNRLKPSSKTWPIWNTPGLSLRQNGVVIDRKVDPGQTVAASFQTPEMFTSAPTCARRCASSPRSMKPTSARSATPRTTVYQCAFTVQGYPDDLFEGKIFEIRMNSTTTQNVVTYPVVVSVPNPRSETAARADRRHLVSNRRNQGRAADPECGPPVLPTARACPPGGSETYRAAGEHASGFPG